MLEKSKKSFSSGERQKAHKPLLPPELFNLAQLTISRDEQKILDQNWSKTTGLEPCMLMEQAAAAAFHYICNNLALKKHSLSEEYRSTSGEKLRFLIYAGYGQNAGDAWALARQLRSISDDVLIFDLACDKILPNASQMMRKACIDLDIEQIEVRNSLDFEYFYERYLANARNTIIIDGIFGTGFRLERGLNSTVEDAIDMIQELREHGATCVSLDVPSGVDANNGAVHKRAVSADICLSFVYPKQGLLFMPAAAYAGKIEVLPIGIQTDKESMRKINAPVRAITRELLGKIFPHRKADSHKGSYGRVALIAGSKAMPGALLLAAEAALRSGAGYVEVISEPESAELCLRHLPEILLSQLDDEAHLEALLKRNNVFAVGPGWGINTHNLDCLQALLASDANLVLDADALNLLAENYSPEEIRQCLAKRSEHEVKTLLTPHPGEFERLAPDLLEAAKGDYLQAVRAFAKESCSLTLYKSSRSLIALPDGRCLVLPRSCSGLARAGSGDVLTGLVSALWAQIKRPAYALILAVYIHERTAELISAETSERNLRVSELAASFYLACRELRSFE